jgi:hypothetical protein
MACKFNMALLEVRICDVDHERLVTGRAASEASKVNTMEFGPFGIGDSVFLGLLASQLPFECLLPVRYPGFVPSAIDERFFVAVLKAGILGVQAKVISVRAEKNIARQALKHLELALVRVSDIGKF